MPGIARRRLAAAPRKERVAQPRSYWWALDTSAHRPPGVELSDAMRGCNSGDAILETAGQSASAAVDPQVLVAASTDPYPASGLRVPGTLVRISVHSWRKMRAARDKSPGVAGAHSSKWGQNMAGDLQGADVVYLDYNATAPLRPEALEAALGALQRVGNASSMHHPGREAAARVDAARRSLADLISCTPGEIIFTSGATEANNLALRAGYGRGGMLVTTAAEHLAVVETARTITAERPESLLILPVNKDGSVDLEPLSTALRDHPVALVSLMLANNETGVLTDLAPVCKAAHEAGALVHTDATQYVGRLPLDLGALDVDLLSLSAHKFGGPQGVGALFVRRGTPLPHLPLLVGGGHERGWRAGTLNVAGITGLGAAAQAARRQLADEVARVTALRDALEAALIAGVADCRINGARVPRLPGVTSVTFPGVPADAVLAAMPQVAASDGSACSSGAPSPSHVLLAMGHSRDDAESTVRFTLGYATTERDIERAAAAAIDAVRHVRSVMAATTEP